MAKKALIQKQQKTPKFKVRHTCAPVRPSALVPQARPLPICLREMAHAGELPGVKKASW